MKKNIINKRKKKPVSADDIAEKAMNGMDISEYFSGKGKMIQAVQRVNVDFTKPMLEELDLTASELNISRQAVIKMLVRQSLDQHLLAKHGKR